MKLSATQEPQRSQLLQHASKREEQLLDLSKDASDRAIKALFIVNAGGAVAVLSFMGASADVRGLLGPKIALFLFVIGVILSVALYAFILHRMEWLLRNYQKDLFKYLQDNIGWDELTDNDNKRVRGKNSYISYIIGYIGYVCFIAGAVISLFQF